MDANDPAAEAFKVSNLRRIDGPAVPWDDRAHKAADAYRTVLQLQNKHQQFVVMIQGVEAELQQAGQAFNEAMADVLNHDDTYVIPTPGVPTTPVENP